MKSSKTPLVLIVLFGVSTTATILWAVDVPSNLDERELVKAIQGQMGILRWIGGIMVGGLVTAVIGLWRALRQEQKEMRAISSRSAKALERLTAKLENRHLLKE